MIALPIKRSEEHTSELQSRLHLVCRLLLEKKKATRGRRTGCRAGPFLAMTARDMRIAFALAAALTPVAASAVTLTVHNRSDEVRIGINECQSLQLIARWDLQTTPTGTDRIRLLGARNGSGACSSTSATTLPDRTFLDRPPTAQSEFETVSASDMVLSTSDAGVVQP